MLEAGSCQGRPRCPSSPPRTACCVVASDRPPWPPGHLRGAFARLCPRPVGRGRTTHRSDRLRESRRRTLHCRCPSLRRGRRSCPHREVLAASSSEPPTSVGLACRPVGAWRRHLVKRLQFKSAQDVTSSHVVCLWSCRESNPLQKACSPVEMLKLTTRNNVKRRETTCGYTERFDAVNKCSGLRQARAELIETRRA